MQRQIMGGFDSRNKYALQSNYLCSICSLIYRDPVQLNCGHRYCKSCIDDQNREVITCTQCHEETPRSQMRRDRGMENDMKMLVISCFLCRWNGLFEKYPGHLTMNHLNRFTGSYIENRAIFEVRRLHQIFNEYVKNVRALHATMEEILFNLSPYQMSIEEQNLPTEILQQNHDLFVSYDDTLLMKIDNIQNRLNDNQSVITSPPFYTSPNGYKMCVRLYLNGNGAGQSTHISIYLILMRGNYDAILNWPFNHQIIFGLYDLTNQKNHIIEAFQSDINSICFQQPQDEMNMASGIPKFIPRSRIQQEHSPYICEGSMYIKVMVRKNPIPTSILAKMMNINPALPAHAQEEIIENEIQRNKMSSLKLNLTLKPQQSL